MNLPILGGTKFVGLHLVRSALDRGHPVSPFHRGQTNPGLIVGPYDPADRFTYGPARVARGGRAAPPGGPDRPVQFIDPREAESP